jgi:hypothetical protein
METEKTAADPILDADAVIEAASPALWAALSPLGRKVRQPASFLPLQTAEARGKPFNATIGQITDGHGRAVPLPSMASALAGLGDAERSQAFLYSPVEGLAPLRARWRDWQRRGQPEGRPSSLPLVTVSPAHARALAAQMFAGEGRAVVVLGPGLPGDRDLFETRLGARLHPSLADLPAGEPALVVLRSPAGGVRPLVTAAGGRPLIVLVEDPNGAHFWDLIGRHENLIPVKVDGAGGVGFLTFPFDPESGIAKALESKLKMLLRAEVGSPSAAAQTILLAALP